MLYVTTTEARRIFSEMINQVAYGKLPMGITRRGRVMAVLVCEEDADLLQHVKGYPDLLQRLRDGVKAKKEEEGGE